MVQALLDTSCVNDKFERDLTDLEHGDSTRVRCDEPNEMACRGSGGRRTRNNHNGVQNLRLQACPCAGILQCGGFGRPNFMK